MSDIGIHAFLDSALSFCRRRVDGQTTNLIVTPRRVSVLSTIGKRLKGPSIYDVRKLLGFFDPSPLLVRIWDWSTVLNSRNLPYYIFFWANPPSPLSADVIYGCPQS